MTDLRNGVRIVLKDFFSDNAEFLARSTYLRALACQINRRAVGTLRGCYRLRLIKYPSSIIIV